MKNLHDIIKKPCLTEKAMSMQEDNKVVIKVDKRANKIEIKRAVETMFKVEVANVHTVSARGKQKRMGKYIGQTCDWKKAIVTLAEGHSLDFLEEL